MEGSQKINKNKKAKDQRTKTKNSIDGKEQKK